MASIQTYKGKGRDYGKTFYRMQPYLPNGKRATFRLGTGIKQARRTAVFIQELIDSRKADDDPNPATRAWINGIARQSADEATCKLLLKHDLIDELPRGTDKRTMKHWNHNRS